MCGLRCSNCGAKSWLQVGCLALCSFNLLEHPCVNKWYSWSFSEAHAVTHLWPMSVYVEFLDHNAQCWTQVWCEMLHYYVHVCVDRPKSLTDRNVRAWFGTQSWANVGTVYWDSRCSAVCSQHFNVSFWCFTAFDIGAFKFGGLLLQLLLRPAHFICVLGVLQWTRTLSINSTRTGWIDCWTLKAHDHPMWTQWNMVSSVNMCNLTICLFVVQVHFCLLSTPLPLPCHCQAPAMFPLLNMIREIFGGV